MPLKQNKCFGTHFCTEQGDRQGDIISPTIFNIIIDTVIRASEENMKAKSEEKKTIIFYADDGFIGGYNPIVVQQTLDKFVTKFKNLVYK
jgi:Reverse transcriptase (RNA-dependent DNA polymerase)